MKKLYSMALVAVIPFIHFCEHPEEQPPSLVVKTIDGMGRITPAKLVYESRDCEYDFLFPTHVSSSGIVNIEVASGPFQIYAEGYLHESYTCFNFSDNKDTLTLYAAPIPTYVKVSKSSGAPVINQKVQYFANESGNCVYEEVNAEEVKTGLNGIAVIYLPQGNTYKIQSKRGKSKLIECYQPEQRPDTLQLVF